MDLKGLWGWIRFPNRKQKQRFVPVTFQIGDRLWPIVTDCDQTRFAKKTKKNRSDRFQTESPIVTDCDRHKCHIWSLRLEWLVQILFLFLFEIRLGPTFIIYPVFTRCYLWFNYLQSSRRPVLAGLLIIYSIFTHYLLTIYSLFTHYYQSGDLAGFLRWAKV